MKNKEELRDELIQELWQMNKMDIIVHLMEFIEGETAALGFLSQRIGMRVNPSQISEELNISRARTANIHATLVNPRFVTELDRNFLTNIARTHRLVVTIEDGVLEGGWGEKVARFLGPLGARVRCHGVHVGFPDRYDPRELLAENGMTVEAMAEDTMRLLEEIQ